MEIGPSERFRVRHHGYMIENELFWRGIEGWEKISLELWLRLCRQSSVILDIGANTGIYALAAHAVAPNATVVAAEPVARVFAKLEDNIALNNANIIAIRAAISDRSGTATLYDLSDSDHVLSVSLEPEWNSSNKNLQPVEVPCLTVMDLLEHAGKRKVDLMKIDVETHEPQVLEGCKELIRKDRPTLLIEILNEEVAQRIGVILEGLDYVYYDIDDVTWPPRQVQRPGQSGHFNYLICQPSVAVSIGL